MNTDKEQFLTIKEFAVIAGVSVQSIYKRLNRLNNPLNLFLNQVKNTTLLSTRALSEVYGLKYFKTFKPDFKPSLNPTNPANETLEKELAYKNKQLEAKDEQIAFLHKLLDQEQQLRLQDVKRIQQLEQAQQLLLEKQAHKKTSSNFSSRRRWSNRKGW